MYHTLELIRHAHGNLCKHLGIDSSTDLPRRYRRAGQEEGPQVGGGEEGPQSGELSPGNASAG